MKVSSDFVSNFIPITFTITCETESELKVLYAQVNTSISGLLCDGELVDITNDDLRDGNGGMFYNKVNKVVRKIGLKK